MSKAQRIRQQSARERIAAQQAAARRAEQRRKMLWFGGAIVVVIAVVVALVVVKLGQNSATSSASASSTTGTPLPASVSKNVTDVPASVLTSVGAGSVPSYNSKAITTITGPTLTSASKPEMLYIGAEFCPYCAAMRWSMAVALSRFGTLSPLHGSHSSSTDTDPNTPTLTFYKTSYTSKYLTFVPVENETITHAPLQNTTAAQSAIWAKYEPNASQRGYPFIDFGNRYMITGPIFDPAVLAGLSWQQVAADLHNPSSPVAQGAIGAANYITAAICKITNNAPASVCTTAPASTLEPKL
jgi:thiol-disulfide isomerase/thioredoxin